jgi:glycosyltransferase involved in cell wall biosynthesis
MITKDNAAGPKRKFLQLRPDSNPGEIPISIVIPAHNEEEFLPATLTALRNQTYGNFEVIVVANGCSDRTLEAAQGACDQLIELEERGLGKARNLGALKARGEILLFLDADTLLEPRSLEIIAHRFQRCYAMGTLLGQPDTRKFSYKLIYCVKNLIHWTRIHHGSSGVILCWKDFFMNVGGFDEELYLRENSDLLHKLHSFGKYCYIRQTPAVTSMRRYEKKGTREMVWLWLRVWWLSIFSDLRNKTYEVVDSKHNKDLRTRVIQPRKASFVRRNA